MTGPFVQTLATLLHAHDRSGVWEGVPDERLLAPFIVTREQRRSIPLIGDPSPEILWRADLFYGAAALLIEKQAGRMAQPLVKVNHEGWGRAVIIAGKLVAVDISVRELHRFGFETVEALEERGMKLVRQGVDTIERFPDTATA